MACSANSSADLTNVVDAADGPTLLDTTMELLSDSLAELSHATDSVDAVNPEAWNPDALSDLDADAGVADSADEDVPPDLLPPDLVPNDIPEVTTQDAADALPDSDVETPPSPCPLFNDAQAVGLVNHPPLDEASGIAASWRNPGYFWVHTDSGDTARVFAISATGEVVAEYQLGGVSANDWEDIAVGPGPEAGASYVYVGDIGDNPKTRPSISVLRFKEPELDLANAPYSAELAASEQFTLTYPEGKSYDCETLAVDPISGTVILVVKNGESPAPVFGFIPPALPPQEAIQLSYIGDLPMGIATGGDFSPDGALLIVRNYFQAQVWLRSPDAPKTVISSIQETFTSHKCTVPVKFEGLAEAITFNLDSSGYFTLSEGVGENLYFHQRIDGPPQ
jgi:hypothetical protein